MINLLYDRNGVNKLKVLKSPVFIGVLILKIISSFIFASDYLIKLFSRFVNYFIVSGFNNPYEFFYNINMKNIFPYPSFMLWILSIPRYLFSFILSNDYNIVTILHVFIYRIPIIIADIIILAILTRWFKTKEEKVLKYYWCSPILFYINYMHGQLDALPIMFLFVFLYLLFKEKYMYSFIFLSLSICTKTNIIVVLPFVIVYLMVCEKSIDKIIKMVLIVVLGFLLINIGYVFSNEFKEIVLHNQEQIKIFNFNYKFSDELTLYVLPAIYIILFLKSLTYKMYNKDIFMMYLGFSFCILTFCIPPMQGWYYWIVPFLIYFYLKEENTPKYSYYILNIAYFLYFLVIKECDYLNIFQLILPYISRKQNLYQFLLSRGFNADVIVNMVFTLLQSVLLINVYWIYKIGIKNNVKCKLKYKPFLLGIGGDSGSGKSTISDMLLKVFQSKNTLVIRGDDMHKWERGDNNWKKYTHLDPKANYLHNELSFMYNLKNGQAISRRHYNHDNGKFTSPQKISSNKLVIFEGLHPFYLNKMRSVYDLKVFVKPEESLRIHWKIIRDIAKRGYSKETILAQINQRAQDSEVYINSQEQYSNIVVSICNKTPIQEIGDSDLKLDLYLKFKFENDINVDPLINEILKLKSIEIDNYYDDNNQYLEFYGDITKEKIDYIAYNLIPELEEVVIDEPEWEDGYGGLIQLFICYCIFYKVRLEQLEV